MVEKFPARTAQRHRFFGPPPLLKGEDPAAYDQLLARATAAIEPADFIEEIFVRDFVDLDWEIVRVRRLKSDLVNQALLRELKRALERLRGKNSDDGDDQDDDTDDGNEVDIDALLSGWMIGDQDASKQIEEILKSDGLTIQDLLVPAAIYELDEIERLNKIITTAEARRNAILREIDRHRQALGQQLRRLPEQIDDAEYKVVEPSGQLSKIASQSRQRTS